jgi:glycosyltransferase involved in cell wall biosynthesis
MNVNVISPLVTIAVPSFNQGRFLDDALASIFNQAVAVEVFVADGGSTDETLAVIRKWASRLAGWRSHRDGGQAAAINECIARGTAPYVAWLNSDDLYLPGGLSAMLESLQNSADWPAIYGKAWNVDAQLRRISRVRVQAFSRSRLARRCVISQPATLIRRSAWEAVGGLDESLHMALDYDLWWRLFNQFGVLGYVGQDIALNRDHAQTKTRTQRKQHYREAVTVVRKHHGRVPFRWWLAWPVSVWLRACLTTQKPVADGV